MNDIIPAIMPKNYDELYSAIESVVGLVPIAQIDIMDGQFVPNFSWPYVSGVPKPTDEHFLNMVAEKEGLPFWEKIDVELDLMVKNVDENLDQWIAIGPKRIVVHFESLENPDNAFAMLKNLQGVIEVGISSNNDTPQETIEKYLNQVDFIQCMGIAKVGFQEQVFDPRVIDRISYFHKKYPDLSISVDGAVHTETIQSLKEAGATRFVSGSGVFGDGEGYVDIKSNIQTLERV